MRKKACASHRKWTPAFGHIRCANQKLERRFRFQFKVRRSNVPGAVLGKSSGPRLPGPASPGPLPMATLLPRPSRPACFPRDLRGARGGCLLPRYPRLSAARHTAAPSARAARSRQPLGTAHSPSGAPSTDTDMPTATGRRSRAITPRTRSPWMTSARRTASPAPPFTISPAGKTCRFACR